MTPEIWQDIHIRLNNLRGDMVGQWQGDLSNHEIEVSITSVGLAITQWAAANPTPDPVPPGPGSLAGAT